MKWLTRWSHSPWRLGQRPWLSLWALPCLQAPGGSWLTAQPVFAFAWWPLSP